MNEHYNAPIVQFYTVKSLKEFLVGAICKKFSIFTQVKMSSLSLREFLLRFYSSLGCSIRILLCHKVDGSPRGSIWLFFTSGTQSIFLWNIYISLMLLHPGEFKHFLTKMSCSLMLHFAAIRAAIKPKKKPWCNNNLMCWHLYDRLIAGGQISSIKGMSPGSATHSLPQTTARLASLTLFPRCWPWSKDKDPATWDGSSPSNYFYLLVCFTSTTQLK